MKTVQTLIALARAKFGTDRELAEAMGIHPIALTEMKKGRRAVSPECVVVLCDILGLSGEECREWVAIAILENPKNASKLELLRRALFACWAAGVAVLTMLPNGAEAKAAGFLTTTTEAGQLQPWNFHSIHCRALATLARLIRQAMRSCRRGGPCVPRSSWRTRMSA